MTDYTDAQKDLLRAAFAQTIASRDREWAEKQYQQAQVRFQQALKRVEDETVTPEPPKA